MTIEQDASRIIETFHFYRLPGTLTVTHDNGLACLSVVSDAAIEPRDLWLLIASHRENNNAAMRITLNGQLYRICPQCNILGKFDSLDGEMCDVIPWNSILAHA